LEHYEGSYPRAVMDLYPELQFHFNQFQNWTASKCSCIPSSFGLLANEYWSSENQRMFFDELAQELGFTPLELERWYSVTMADVLDKKVIWDL